MIFRILPILVLILLTACSTRELPPVSVYTLQVMQAPPARPHQPGTTRQKPTLKLDDIQSARPFTTTQMLYTKTGLDQNSFAYSRWSDSPVSLLRQLLVEKLSRSNLFAAVLPTDSTVRSNLLLESNLLDFSLHMDTDKTEGVLEIRFLLLDRRDGQVISNRLFRAAVPVASANPANTAAALEQATSQVADQLLSWLTRTLHQITG